MLNTIYLVDCDCCGRQFDRMAIAFQDTQHTEAISTLTELLEGQGWHVFHCTYKCRECLLELLASDPRDKYEVK